MVTVLFVPEVNFTSPKLISAPPGNVESIGTAVVVPEKTMELPLPMLTLIGPAPMTGHLFPSRCLSFSGCFPMTRHVLPILGAPVGLTALSARIAARLPSPSALSPDPVFWSAVRVAAKPASWSAPSWNAVIRRSASGSGPRTSSPARRRGCRRCSFSGNLG